MKKGTVTASPQGVMSEKMIKVYKAVENGTVNTYRKIEKGSVEAYRRVERCAVNGYQKIEEAVVNSVLGKRTASESVSDENPDKRDRNR